MMMFKDIFYKNKYSKVRARGIYLLSHSFVCVFTPYVTMQYDP